jgi:hypothetical protein
MPGMAGNPAGKNTGTGSPGIHDDADGGRVCASAGSAASTRDRASSAWEGFIV